MLNRRTCRISTLVTQYDHALPADVQHKLAIGARNEEAEVIVREINSSHSPMLSRPRETVAFLIEAAKLWEG